MAVILGIYERVIGSVNEVIENKFQSGKEELAFLLFLGSGILTSLVIFLNLISYLLLNYSVGLFGFFAGIILSSGVLMAFKLELVENVNRLALVIGATLAFLVSGISTAQIGHQPLILFFSGTLAVTALVVPGVSGSLILLILGQYVYMVEAFTDFIDALFESFRAFSLSQLSDTAYPVFSFVLGALVGLVVTVKAVKKSLGYNRKLTMAFLVGLVIGSTRAPLEQIRKSSIPDGGQWLSIGPEFTVSFLTGLILVMVVERQYGINLE